MLLRYLNIWWTSLRLSSMEIDTLGCKWSDVEWWTISLMDQESGVYILGESKIGTRYHILKYTLLFRLEFCMLIYCIWWFYTYFRHLCAESLGVIFVSVLVECTINTLITLICVFKYCCTLFGFHKNTCSFFYHFRTKCGNEEYWSRTMFCRAESRLHTVINECAFRTVESHLSQTFFILLLQTTPWQFYFYEIVRDKRTVFLAILLRGYAKACRF